MPNTRSKSGKAKAKLKAPDDDSLPPDSSPEPSDAASAKDAALSSDYNPPSPFLKKRQAKQSLESEPKKTAKLQAKRTSRNIRKKPSEPVKAGKLVSRKPPTETYQSQALRLMPSSETPNLNAWLNAVEHLSVKPDAEIRLTEMSTLHTQLVPLGQLPDMHKRDFKYSISSAVVDITWDPQPGQSTTVRNYIKVDAVKAAVREWSKKKKTWSIHVWNDSLPKSEQTQYRLFPEIAPVHTKWLVDWKRNGSNKKSEPEDRYKFWVTGGPLDVDICPTEKDVVKVAMEACRLLNKFPSPIESLDFPEEMENHQYCRSGQSMRQIIELQSLRILRDDFDFRSLRYTFRAPHVPAAYHLNPLVSALSMYRGKDVSWFMRVPVLVPNKDIPKGEHFHRIEFVEEHCTQEMLDSLPEVPEWWGVSPITPPDNKIPKKSNLPLASAMKLATYLTYNFFAHVGMSEAVSLNCSPLHILQSKRRKRETSGPFNGKPLFRPQAEGRIRISREVADTIEGTLPTVYTQLQASYIALAMQSAYEVFMTQSDILRTLQELFVTIDELAVKKKSLLSKETYCKCGDNIEVKSKTAHYCMVCLKLVLCSMMGKHIDGRLICLSHLKAGPLPPDQIRAARMRRKCLKEEPELPIELRSRMSDVILNEHLLPDSGFRDMYGPDRPEEIVSRALRMSVDAIFPLWMDGGEYFVHHPGNVGLTTAFMNHFKGSDIPFVLRIAAEATKKKGKGVYLSHLELVADHSAKIRYVIPWSKKSRITFGTKSSKDFWPAYLEMMKSGTLGSPFAHTQEDHHVYKRSRNSSWTLQDKTRLSKIVEEIAASEEFNPGGALKLPYNHSNSQEPPAPWLWAPSHIFLNHDWDFLAFEFAKRFDRMDNACDWINDHSTESKDNLFLTTVIWWFESDGGKDAVLGLRLNVFPRHFLRYSVGRSKKVQPGSKMLTGWTVP